MANYPVPYQNNFGYAGTVGQQMYPQLPQSIGTLPSQVQTAQQTSYGIKWVDGEVGAKAWQMPQGWPANQPIALWDTNDTVVYLKSINPMGMPNPLQKARYVLEDGNSGEKSQGYSGNAEQKMDMSDYVRKEDLEQMKHELMEAINGTAKRTAKGE